MIEKKKTGSQDSASPRKRTKSQREATLEALHENEERMRAIVEGTPHLFFYTQDAEANTTYVSPTIERITGYKIDIWLKRKDWFITDATINQVAKERTHANLRGEFTEGPQLLEVRHASGHPILLEAYEYPITKNGRIVGLQGVAHDITQHKRAESQREAALKALRESKEKYRILFDNANEAIFVVQDGKLVFCNPMTTRLMGYSSEEIRTKPFIEFIYPDDRGMVVERHMKRLRGEETPARYSFRIVDREGNTHHAEISAVLINWEGKAATLNFANDITERKLVDSQKKAMLEALRKSEENFRRSLEDSPLGVRIASANGETIYANKVLLDIYGYANIEELNKIPLKERYTPQSYAEFRIRKKAREDGDSNPSEYEINIVRKNKEIRHLLVLRKEVFWNGSKQFQVIYQDISERKRAESQREAALEALRKSEENFRHSLDDSPLGVRIVTAEGETIYANRAILDIYGFSSIEELRTTPVEKRYTAESYIEYKKRYERRQRGGDSPSEYEVSVVRKNGEVRHLLVSRKGQLWNGEMQYQALYRDITERKKAEEDKRRTEERSSKLVEDVFRFIPEGILVFSRKMELLRQNQAFRELVSKYAKRLGFAEDELENLIIDKVRVGLRDNNIKEIRIARKYETGKQA